jgi:hypothetical protein
MPRAGGIFHRRAKRASLHMLGDSGTYTLPTAMVPG